MIDQQLARNARVLDGDVARFKDYLAAIVFCFRKDLIDFAADHSCDYAAFVQISCRISSNCFPIPQHGNAIANAKDFVEFVRNVNHRHAADAQLV